MQLAFFLTFMTLLVGIALSVAWDHSGLPQWTGVRMKRNRRTQPSYVKLRASRVRI